MIVFSWRKIKMLSLTADMSYEMSIYACMLKGSFEHRSNRKKVLNVWNSLSFCAVSAVGFVAAVDTISYTVAHHSWSHTILLVITQKVILQRTYSRPVPDSVEILQNKSNNFLITFLLGVKEHSRCGSMYFIVWFIPGCFREFLGFSHVSIAD